MEFVCTILIIYSLRRIGAEPTRLLRSLVGLVISHMQLVNNPVQIANHEVTCIFIKSIVRLLNINSNAFGIKKYCTPPYLFVPGNYCDT